MHKTVERLISIWDLIDLKPKRGRYTWSNNHTGEANIAATMDQFLIQNSVLLENKIISIGILPKLTSDHKPILLQLEDEEDLSPIPFRFSPLWIHCDGFLATVFNA